MNFSAWVMGLERAHRLDNARLRILIFLRWYALAGVSLVLLLAWWLEFQGLAWTPLLIFVGLGITYNVMLSSLPVVPNPDSFQSIYYLQLVLDISALSGLLWASGGVSNPFSNLFLLHVVVAALIGSRASVLLAGGLASGAAVLLHVLAKQNLLLGAFEPPPILADSVHLLALLVDAVSIAAVVGALSARFQAREARLSEARTAVRLREAVLDRVVSGLSVAVEVVRNGEVIWQNAAMNRIRSRQVGEVWVCPGAQQSCNRALEDTEGHCIMPEQDNHHACLVKVHVDEEDRVYRKFTWRVSEQALAETVHMYVDETSRLAEEERLRLTERLASLGRMAQGLAHELNTPLSTVRTLTRDAVEALRASAEVPSALREDLNESLLISLRELERCGRITRGLLQGRDLSGAALPEVQELKPLIQNAVMLVSVGSRRQHVFVVPEVSARAYVDADGLVQVLVNLLSNAVDASPPGSSITLRVEEEAEEVRVLVMDEGSGLSPQIRRRLFEPFATTKPPGQGTGLGLYLARQLLLSFGATLTLENRETGGATALLVLRRQAPVLLV